MNTATEKINSPDLIESQHESNYSNQNWEFLSGEELGSYLRGCVLNDRMSQKKIYNSFFSYAMSICSRYTSNYEDSLEIINDGFLKVFKELYRYEPVYANVISSFKGWLRRIMANTAIDHFRKHSKHHFKNNVIGQDFQLSSKDENVLDRISYEEILRSVQKLTPGYRVIFNLFVIDGFTHEKISARLGISIGASKSNLARGRRQLKKILFHEDQLAFPQEINRSRSSLRVVSKYK